MGDHGGAIVAVKHFKTEGPNNVLEYTGLINLIIVRVDLAAVFTKNCALLEDYKHWSPPGRMSSASWGSGSHFGYKTTRGSSLTVSRILTSKMMLAMTRSPLSVHRTHSTTMGNHSACSSIQRSVHQELCPVCPQDTFYTFSRGYVRVPVDKCEGGLASSYGPQKRACPYGPQQTPDLHTHLSATKDFQDGPEQRTPSWRSFP